MARLSCAGGSKGPTDTWAGKAVILLPALSWSKGLARLGRGGGEDPEVEQNGLSFSQEHGGGVKVPALCTHKAVEINSDQICLLGSCT